MAWKEPAKLWQGKIPPSLPTYPAGSDRQPNPHQGQALVEVTAPWPVPLLPPSSPGAATQTEVDSRAPVSRTILSDLPGRAVPGSPAPAYPVWSL